METDASEKWIGGVLLQEGNVIDFYSSTLNNSYKKSQCYRKRTLAIIKSLQHFKKVILNKK